MKNLLMIIVTINSFASYEGSQASDVWEIVSEGQYRELKDIKVNMKRLKKWGKSKLSQSANRTISDRSDILPHFEKLVHANGVCLKGEWEIDKDSPYTGFFKQGAKGIIISRASVALSHTKRGKKRSFGLAGKIYPTTDLDHLEPLKTANFFTMDDLGGTKISHFSKTSLTNEPDLSVGLSSLFMIRMAAFVSKVFNKADKNPNRRQLWQISNLEHDGASVTPMWMRLKAIKSDMFSNQKDFRAEIIETIKENGQMKFSVEVTGFMNKGEGQKKKFRKIGEITFTEFSASSGCDHRLHFNHPKFRSDLN